MSYLLTTYQPVSCRPPPCAHVTYIYVTSRCSRLRPQCASETMFVQIIPLTLIATVFARNLISNGKSYVPVPKYDFSSAEEPFGKDSEELSSDAFKNRPEDIDDHRSFDVQFKHRQFTHSDDGDRTMPESSHSFGPQTRTLKDTEDSYSGRKHKERSDRKMTSKDPESQLETFRSESKTNEEEEKSFSSRRKISSVHSNHGYRTPDFGNFEDHFQGRNNGERRSIDKRNHHNNVQNNKETFNSDFFNSQPEFKGRKTEEQNIKELGGQIQDNEHQFDYLAASQGQIFRDGKPKSQRQQNTDLVTLARSNIKRDDSNQSPYNNTRTDSRANGPVHKLGSKESNDQLRSENEEAKDRDIPKSREINDEVDLRPVFATSAKPAGNSPGSGDMWVWSDGEKKPAGVPTNGVAPVAYPANKTTLATSAANGTTPDVDDRAAFDGNKCPNKKVRMGTICVDID